MLAIAFLSSFLVAATLAAPCSPPPAGIERGSPVEMHRDDISRAGPGLFDQVSVVGFSKDGKVAWIERPAVTDRCVKAGTARTLVVEDARTHAHRCERPIGASEAGARGALLAEFGLEPIRRCCPEPRCDYCLERDPRTHLPLSDYKSVDAFGWSAKPYVAYVAARPVLPDDDAPPECRPALLVKDLVTGRLLVRRPLADLADPGRWEATLKGFGIVTGRLQVHALHSDRVGFPLSGDTVSVYWGQPRHTPDTTPPPYPITLRRSSLGVKQLTELDASAVTSCAGIYPLAAVVSPFGPRAAFFFAVSMPGPWIPAGAPPAAGATRRYRVAVVGAHLESGFGIRTTLELLSRGEPTAATSLAAQLSARGAVVPPAGEAVPILLKAAEKGPLCPIIGVLQRHYPGSTKGAVAPLLRASASQGLGLCRAEFEVLLAGDASRDDLPALVANYRGPHASEVVTLELILRVGGADRAVVDLLKELVAGSVPPGVENPNSERCRATVATALLGSALKGRLPELERLNVQEAACGQEGSVPLQRLWDLALKEIRGSSPSENAANPQLGRGDLDVRMREMLGGELPLPPDIGEGPPESTGSPLDEAPPREEPARIEESIFFFGYWAKHRSYVACSAKGVGQDGVAEECRRCAALPLGFSRFEPGALPCDEGMAVFDGASAGLRADAAAFSKGAGGSRAQALAQRLVTLGVRELASERLHGCGMSASGNSTPLYWWALGFDPNGEVKLPEAPGLVGAERPERCAALGDGTFAVILDRILDEDPWQQAAGIARVAPPPGALSGWLRGASVGFGATAFYAEDPYVTPAGFSREGRFAWIVAQPGAGATLAIADLVKNRVVATRSFPFRGEDDLGALEKRVNPELEKAGVEAPFLPSPREFPVALQTDVFRAHLRPEPGGGCWLCLEGERAGWKRIARLTEAQARREPRIYAAFASPFEPRIAVGLTFAGDGAQKAPREIVFFGAALGAGFTPSRGRAQVDGWDPGSCSTTR